MSAYSGLVADGLFQEWFGDVYGDRGEIEGRAGGDLALYVYGKLRQTGILPFQTNIYVCDQDELFGNTIFQEPIRALSGTVAIIFKELSVLASASYA